MGRTGGDGGQGARPRALQRLWSYLVEPDSFGLVLLLILGTMVTVATTGSAPQGRLAALVVAGTTLLYTLFTCRVRAGVQRAAWLLVGASLVFSALAWRAGTEAVAEAGAVAVSALLVVATTPAIAQRVLRRPVVDAPTVSGALCIYLLLGLFFAYVFGLVNLVEEGTFFTAAGRRTRWTSSTSA